MTTQRSGINLIEPGEYRPPLEFHENGVTVTSFGGSLVAVGHIATDGEVVAEVNGKETYRHSHRAGNFEIRRSSFIDDDTFGSSGELTLKLSIVEGGTATVEKTIRFTQNYGREYDAYRQRDHLRQRQRELLNTHRGANELVQRLSMIAERSAATKSYVTGKSSVEPLADLAREFAGIKRFGDISDDAILATFLEPDAVDLAKTLPNAYWLATCLKAAVVPGNTFQKISAAQLKAGFDAVQNPIKSKLEELAPLGSTDARARDAIKAIEGIYLVTADGKVIVNPIITD